MKLPYDLIQQLQEAPPTEAWQCIFNYAWTTCSAPLGNGGAEGEIARRDRALADIDLYLATAGWDLWTDYETSLDQTADTLTAWWDNHQPGRAVLILDGLSLRELPWLLTGAERHGLKVVEGRAAAAELPPDTTPFAKALGFSQRSALGSNGAGGAHKFPGARTETTDIEWQSCADMIGSQPDWVFWHHWPDKDIHDFSDPGEGLSSLTKKADCSLQSDGFWALVSRLAHGRRLIITSDHGYAASELFSDATPEQSTYLKQTFKSGRWSTSAQESGSWVPPIDLMLDTRHGKHLFVNGRRKWKSAGGYPTLTHGGLSVLEVAVPYLEFTSNS